MTKYQKGKRAERELAKILSDQGYTCILSAGSKGAFDVIAYNEDHVRFIQSKYNNKPSLHQNDMRKIKSLKVPGFCTKELWQRVPYDGWIIVYVFGDAPSNIYFPDTAKIQSITE